MANRAGGDNGGLVEREEDRWQTGGSTGLRRHQQASPLLRRKIRIVEDSGGHAGLFLVLARISQMALSFRHDIGAKTLENPAFPMTSCRNDRGTRWVTATTTPCESISTARSS